MGRGLVIDPITLVARLQMQRRGTVVAKLGTGWITVVAEEAHPVAKILSARGEGPVRGAWRIHAAILSRRNGPGRTVASAIWAVLPDRPLFAWQRSHFAAVGDV